MSLGSSQVNIPFVTADQMREVDRAMVEDYGISLLQMMENAGRGLAHLARGQFLDGDPRGRRVLVLAGTGGNGGDGLVCARRLHMWGADVRIWLTSEASDLAEVPGHQLAILERLGVQVQVAHGTVKLPPADLIVDALIGYSLRGAPRDSAAVLVSVANRHPAPTLALDVPSGLDATTGIAHDPAIQAVATMTLALPKEGLRALKARDLVGELYVADIGVPHVLYNAPPLGLEVRPLFAEAEILRLR